MFSTETSIEERIFSGSLYNFLVLSRAGVKSFTSDLPYIIISITDPENAEAELPKSQNTKAVLRLKFHDVGKPPRQFESKPVETSIDVSMTNEDAQQILSFVRTYLSEVRLIVCHCEQGISRSSAVAAALSKILQNEDEFFFQNYWVNRWVYDLLLENSKNLKIK